MSIQHEAGLILKLYDLRREATMRKARDWYFREFNPESLADIESVMYGEHSGYLRMVMSYWDMAAALVKHGAISLPLFADTHGEHFAVFAKLEPFLAEMRATYGPQVLVNLENLIQATPNGPERVAGIRERLKTIRAEIARRQAKAAGA
jgi:hypothetical protein